MRARPSWMSACWIALGITALASAQDEAAARRAGIAAMQPVMLQAVQAGDFAQARTLCEKMIEWEPQNPVHHYNLACIEARAGGPRLPRALAALEQAVALGFNDAPHLQTDPDLAAIRADPKFGALVRAVAQRTNTAATAATPPGGQPAPSAAPGTAAQPTPRPAAGAPAAARPLPPPAAKPVDLARLANTAPPAPAGFKGHVPVGLYFMTRFWSGTGSLEKAVWYFAPDGTVYQNIENGFAPADLASHRGRKGRAAFEGDQLVVAWSTGRKTASKLERENPTFAWDGGIFTPVRAFDARTPIAGVYEGGESVSFGGSRAAVARTLELRADGTFRWSGVSFLSSESDATRVSAGASDGDSTGRWQASAYALTLLDQKGTVFQRIAFPYDDEKTPLKPDRVFFAGIMYKKRP